MSWLLKLHFLWTFDTCSHIVHTMTVDFEIAESSANYRFFNDTCSSQYLLFSSFICHGQFVETLLVSIQGFQLIKLSLGSQKGVNALQRCSVENQKGISAVQRCSVENQKGVNAVQRCSVENQKGINTVQRCSIENQKGPIAVKSLWW